MPTNEELNKTRERAETMLSMFNVHLNKALREFGEEMDRTSMIEDLENRRLAAAGVGGVAMHCFAKKLGQVIGIGAAFAGKAEGKDLWLYLNENLGAIESTVRAVAAECIKRAGVGGDDAAAGDKPN